MCSNLRAIGLSAALSLSLYGLAVPAEASTSGIDTPTGNYDLPLAVQGQPGLDLSVPTGSPPGTLPTAQFYGPAFFPGPVGIATTAPKTTLDVEGDLTVSGQALINIPSCKTGQMVTGIVNGQPICQPGGYIVGGTYTFNLDGSCRYPNPYTGGCSCPSGQAAYATFDFANPNCANGYYGGMRE